MEGRPFLSFHSQPTGKPTKSYEFPNGYNQAFGDVRFHIPEALFNPASFLKRVSVTISKQ